MQAVTDPLIFSMTKALRRVAEHYDLPAYRLTRGCRALVRQLSSDTDPDYQSVMDSAISEMMRD